MTIKILLVDDHAIVREGLRELLGNREGQQKYEVVGEAGDGRSAVALAKKIRPTIVLMDINMPVLNGVDATAQLREIVPEAKVIALTMHSGRQFVQKMFRAGASGYLLKECTFEELKSAITAVNSGKMYISPSLAGTVIEDYIFHVSIKEKTATTEMTAREREILQLIAEGWSTKRLAEKLFISAKTVETHRRNIMEKLNLYTVAELTKYAVAEGLTFLDN